VPKDLRGFGKAIDYHKQSLAIVQKIKDKKGVSNCYLSLGSVEYKLGNFRRAIDYYLNAENILKQIGQIHYLKAVYDGLFFAYKKIEDHENAEKYKELAKAK